MPVRTLDLPDLGEGLPDGEVVRWLVAVGDRVEVDQPVAEVETAKAVVEVPSPFAGTVAQRHVEEGQEIEVGTPFLSIDEGNGGEAGADGVSAGDGDGDGTSGSVLVGYGTAGSPRARRRGRGRNGAPGPEPAGKGAAPAPPEGQPLAKPPVRKLAKDLGVELASVPPSGPGGVITREDVQAAAEGAEPEPPPTPAPGRPTAPAPGDDVERIPLSGIRRRIAERMVASRREIPSATTWVQADATPLMRLRADMDASGEVRVSALALLLRITVAGLRRVAALNAHFDTEAEETVVHRAIHLGVAVDTDRGLLVPVIHDADRRSTLELAGELARLAEGARGGTLSPAELSGSTFTVSNYGSFGVDGGDPVINHPEVGILGVGQIAERPWVVDGEVRPRKIVELSVAFDHRACDGGPAAEFLRFVADCVEDPATLLGAL